jgi:hypothetical protein
MKSLTLPNISCPACACRRVCKAEYEGIVEQMILRITNICPFLCEACDMRFYMFLVPVEVRSSPGTRQVAIRPWTRRSEIFLDSGRDRGETP